MQGPAQVLNPYVAQVLTLCCALCPDTSPTPPPSRHNLMKATSTQHHTTTNPTLATPPPAAGGSGGRPLPQLTAAAPALACPSAPPLSGDDVLVFPEAATGPRSSPSPLMPQQVGAHRHVPRCDDEDELSRRTLSAIGRRRPCLPCATVKFPVFFVLGLVFRAIRDYPNPNPNSRVPEMSGINFFGQISGTISGNPIFV